MLTEQSELAALGGIDHFQYFFSLETDAGGVDYDFITLCHLDNEVAQAGPHLHVHLVKAKL